MKKLSSASAPRVFSGSSPPATITGKSAKAVIEVKLWLCSCQSRKLLYATCIWRPFSFTSAIQVSRPGSG